MCCECEGWKSKLLALCEGLGIEYTKELISYGGVNEFRFVGEMISAKLSHIERRQSNGVVSVLRDRGIIKGINGNKPN